MGIYELNLNGKKWGNQYFAPGFTSYKTNLQYQTYDITDFVAENNTPDGGCRRRLGGGEPLLCSPEKPHFRRPAGSFAGNSNHLRRQKHPIRRNRQQLAGDGGRSRASDFYDGETYDATVDEEKSTGATPRRKTAAVAFHSGGLRGPVVAHERMTPFPAPGGEKNLSTTSARTSPVWWTWTSGAKRDRKLPSAMRATSPDGSLNVKFLRTAKATATYICTDGQHYSPRLAPWASGTSASPALRIGRYRSRPGPVLRRAGERRFCRSMPC